ncbi:hypothetical protein SEA_JSQUARED_70 [Mycobacterium phage Jsquared]|nr:hypothetical protein SEA_TIPSYTHETREX_66 [Mycobacterium phage TipsytheTRex]AVP41912.1 hypothetical protein SEA_JSQUARED_70 [Mycobacterium phage Jsquared]
MKTVAALLILIAAIFGVTACEGGSGTTTDTGPNGVIFMPAGKGTLIPIFY